MSAFPVDGTFPTGTAQWEKRNIALEIPAWDPEICIQCGKCAIVCPHATIRIKAYDDEADGEGAADLQVDDGQGQRIQPKAWPTPSRSLRKIAPDAACAWMCALPRTRRKRA